MNKFLKSTFLATALVVAFVVPVTAEDPPDVSSQESDLFPPNAKAGECYARVFVPPVYRTESETLLKKDASQKIQITPGKYEWLEERRLSKEASERWEVVPATYEWSEERVLVKPATTKLVDVPAQYEMVTERVLDRPAHTVWKKGTGPYQKVDNATGEIMCLVEVPATYKTVTKQVLKSPATTREVTVPAEYKTVRKQVLKTPPSVRKVSIPAEYQTVKVMREVAAPAATAIQIPAEYQTVTRTQKISEGHMEWQNVLCETNTTMEMVYSIQRALQKGGYYSGPIDGIIGTGTMAGVRSYQKTKGLPQGFLTLETIRSLGISVN